MSEEIMVPMKDQRDISTVTTEIRTLHAQAQRMILGYAIEIGRRLTEAKKMLPHGQWGEYLKTEVEFSQSTAQNFMRIFEEYGDVQISLFGDAKSKTLGNLPYTHALKLLAIPAEEREQFAEEHRVDELSSRELEKLIRERDEARAEAEEKDAALREAADRLEDAEDKLVGAEEDLEKAQAAREDAEERAAAAEERLSDVEARWQAKVEKEKAEAARLLEEAAKAAESAKKAKEKLKALQENPEVPAEVLERLKGEAAAEAEKQLEAARKEAEAKAEEAEKAAKAAEERAAAAEKKLRTADAETAAFKARFVDIQRAFATLREMRQAAEEDKAAGMQRAVLALLEQERGLWA